ncbi:hypothetical protein [Thalassobellus suaedae]|uniref:STAS/SEC14 domain-containing protein n=1 Tax=Thalassobellus suaedae TaxID=3074124 RepID=A0ABY9XW60_9FLAO|nr:hypothetical protein RHP51_04600 [Flavobacteriaceae bacterium HL-DH14]
MRKTLTLPLGTFYIYDNYLIVEINEGETITTENNKILENIAITYFNTKKFIYITHRVNSYAVDPAIYRKTSLIENLAGFAVVATNNIALSNADIEKLFLNKPFESFTKLNKAIEWGQSILKQNNIDIKNS